MNRHSLLHNNLLYRKRIHILYKDESYETHKGIRGMCADYEVRDLPIFLVSELVTCVVYLLDFFYKHEGCLLDFSKTILVNVFKSFINEVID